MRISAIICTFNRRALLEKAIASLACQDLPRADYEIIVVDNACTDGTRAAVEALLPGLPNLRYVFEPALGLSNARNRGVQEARGDIVAFMDDDAEAGPGWLAALIRAFDRDPGRLVCVGGKVEPMWERLPPRGLPLFAYVSLSLVDYGASARRLDFPREGLAGCNFALSRDYLLAADGFNPHLGRSGAALLSNEEIAVFRGVVAAGGCLLYEPSAVVRHLVPASRLRSGWFCRRMFAQGVSNVRLGACGAASVHRGGEMRAILKARSATELALPLLLIACYGAGVVTETARRMLPGRRAD